MWYGANIVHKILLDQLFMLNAVTMKPYLQGGARGGTKAAATHGGAVCALEFPLGRFKASVTLDPCRGKRAECIPVTTQR